MTTSTATMANRASGSSAAANNGKERVVENGDDKKLRLEQQAKNRGKLVLAVLIAAMAFAAKLGWDALMNCDFHDQFFARKSEYLYMHNMSRIAKTLLVESPFLADYTRRILEMDMSGHKTLIEDYNPEKHDKTHRALVTNLLTKPECARIRSVLLRHSLKHGVTHDGESVDKSLHHEFSSLSLFNLLGVWQSEEINIQEEEKALLSDVLQRVQRAAEKKFNASNFLLEYSDITVRRNPTPEGWFNAFRRLHYLTTGGHDAHSDQCATQFTPESHHNGFVCNMLYEHCCAHRTHSVLLYLNDPDDGDLVGGDLYLVERHDLLNESKPSYSGIGLAKQFQHTVRVKPTCGNLMLFASDARNIHGTYPIHRGSRFAMPMWFTNPEDIPWHEPDIAKDQMSDVFWEFLHRKCQFMGRELPVPSGLRKYLGDCDGMVEAVKELASWRDHVPSEELARDRQE